MPIGLLNRSIKFKYSYENLQADTTRPCFEWVNVFHLFGSRKCRERWGWMDFSFQWKKSGWMESGGECLYIFGGRWSDQNRRAAGTPRSEERRVGKESRTGW